MQADNHQNYWTYWKKQINFLKYSNLLNLTVRPIILEKHTSTSCFFFITIVFLIFFPSLLLLL